ncbi:OmpA family protein [Spirosoma fluviale]|uniref:Outer membrane protein OmpA n=1 Tax=Spirosoma fluviale TaxID=1597977 RepID=A0A286F6B5_9BACT|nr:OmpA family protein [Spirosoma fluviale]SOD78748.1 Outer membrane protein OmpA [Spirosoma fluviale]
MKWIKYSILAGGLYLVTLSSLTVFAQPQHQVAPTEGTAFVEGSIKDAQTKKPIAGATIMAKNQDGIVRAQQTTNANGEYELKLDSRQSYIFTTKAQGYITLDEQLSFTSAKADRMMRMPTLLFRVTPQSPSTATTVASAAKPAPVSPSPVVTKPVSQPPVVNTAAASTERVTPPKTLDAKVVYTPPLVVAPVGKTTQLQALQFIQSKTELLPDAQPALEQILQFMQSKPTAEIELSGHTDNQGDFDQNLLLSKQRVEVIKAYLVKSGIAANRITTRGYGPTRPIASNNSETTRQQNRRVEMIVLKQ